VTSIKQARRIVMVDQHGCSSRPTATTLEALGQCSMAMAAVAFSFASAASSTRRSQKGR
jgi:hypothetical protein